MHGQPCLDSDGAAGQIGILPIGGAEVPPESGYGVFEWAAGSVAFKRVTRWAIAKAAMAGTPVQVALQKAQDRIFDDPTTMRGGRNDD
jgi:hypothetical protein